MESNFKSQHDSCEVWLQFITGLRELTHDAAGLVRGAGKGEVLHRCSYKRYFNDKI